MLTGMTPIILKLEEEVAHYKIKQRSGQRDIEWDCDVEIQNWPHPAEVGTIHEVTGYKDTPIQVYTDGSKQEQGVGSGAVIFKESEMIAKKNNLNYTANALKIRQDNWPYSKHWKN
jgi:hypothetical protein